MEKRGANIRIALVVSRCWSVRMTEKERAAMIRRMVYGPDVDRVDYVKYDCPYYTYFSGGEIVVSPTPLKDDNV